MAATEDKRGANTPPLERDELFATISGLPVAPLYSPENVEVAYRAFSTEEGADASEIGVVTGIAPAFDVGVVAPRPMFSTAVPNPCTRG